MTNPTPPAPLPDEGLATRAQKREAAWLVTAAADMTINKAVRPYFDAIWDLADTLIDAPLLADQAFTAESLGRVGPSLTATGIHARRLMVDWAREETSNRADHERGMLDRARHRRIGATRDELLESIDELTAALLERQSLEN